MKKDLQKYFIAFISIFFITFTFNIEAQNQSSDREVRKPNIKYKKARAWLIEVPVGLGIRLGCLPKSP